MKLSEILSKPQLDNPPRKRSSSTSEMGGKTDKSEDHINLTSIQEPSNFRLTFGKRLSREMKDSTLPTTEPSMRKETIHKKILEKHLKVTISYNNKYLKCFKKFTSILVWYSVITSLAFLVFNDYMQDFLGFDEFIWSIFLLEFILEFFTNFINRKLEKVANLNLIFIHYVKKNFIIDLISIIPLRWFGHPFTEYMLRTLRMFKMQDIRKILNLNSLNHKISTVFYIPGSFQYKRLRSKLTLMSDIFSIIVKMLFGTYFFACTWYSFAEFIWSKNYEDETFFGKYDLGNKGNGNALMIIWYFIFTTLATVGYGDFVAMNKYEMGNAILLVLIGSAWFAFLMGRSVKIMESLSDLNGLKDIREKLNLWLSNMEENYSNLPFSLRQKVILHYLNYWQNDRLKDIRIINFQNGLETSISPISFYASLPEPTKRSLVSHFFCDLHYQFTHFFKHFYKIKHELSLYLHPRIFTPGSFILKHNKSPHEIYFINYGSFSIGINSDGKWQELRVISRRFLIGDYFLLSGTKSFVGFKAKTTVRGYGLPAHVLKRLIQEHNIDCQSFLEFLKEGYYCLLDDYANLSVQGKDQESNWGFRQKKFNWGRLRSVLCFENFDNFKAVLDKVDGVTRGIEHLDKQRNENIKLVKETLTKLARSRLSCDSIDISVL